MYRDIVDVDCSRASVRVASAEPLQQDCNAAQERKGRSMLYEEETTSRPADDMAALTIPRCRGVGLRSCRQVDRTLEQSASKRAAQSRPRSMKYGGSGRPNWVGSKVEASVEIILLLHAVECLLSAVQNRVEW